MIQPLTRTALVGTSQQGTAGTIDMDHPAEALLSGLPSGDPEHVFLLRAGSRAVFERCGRTTRANVPPLQPCPTEDRPFAPPKIVRLLQNAMASESWDLFIEFLRQLEGTGLLLPPELLPQALAARDMTVREHLRPILGERGRWLSRLNPEWRWVTEGVAVLSGSDHDALLRQWDEGTIAERCRALRTLRHSKPAEARQLFEATADWEKADYRARLLMVFEAGLSAEDEPLLEARLDDRSEQVRRLAAGLLARIPQSALARRMQERAEAMLTTQATGILRKKLKLVCHPPEAIDKVWERDGVLRKVPKGRGKRAVWTESVLAAVRPSLWSQRFAAEPPKLIAAILEDDFSQAVLVGWTYAAASFAQSDQDSAAWVRPLWDHWLAVGQRTTGDQSRQDLQDRLQMLLKAMPDAEDALRPVLKGSVSNTDVEWLSLLALLQRPWSESFGLEYLATIRAVLKHHADNRAYQWTCTLFTAGCALPRAVFSAALEAWEVAGAASGNWHTNTVLREIDKFKATIQTRRDFYQEVPGTRAQ